jgi:hypothetical protein
MITRPLYAHERARIVLELADVVVIREILHHTSVNGGGYATRPLVAPASAPTSSSSA